MALTDKQAKFCIEYLIDLNGTQAAIRAGYSENTAASIANENLRKPEIVAELNRLRGEIAAKTGITPERIMEEYARLGFSDVRKALKWRSEILTEGIDPDSGEPAGIYKNTVALIDSDQIDDDTALAISEIKMDSRGGLSVKLHDKKAALDSMARHLGMFDGKKGADDPELPPLEDSLRAAARDIAFALRRALNEASPK